MAEFRKAWEGKGGWDHLVIVQDQPTPTLVDQKGATVIAWNYCNSTCFSHKDSAVRSLGFLWAWRNRASHVLTLDDDVRPNNECDHHFRDHIRARHFNKWMSTCDVDVRGLPYSKLGDMSAHVHVGLWQGIPDLDAPHQLVCPKTNYSPMEISRLVPRGQFIPMCGMNLSFCREAIPLMLFAPMGEGRPYKRFDDIWCGVVAKKIMDHLGWSMSYGGPACNVIHERASDPMENLIKEAPGIGFNETFWQIVDEIDFGRYDNVIMCLYIVANEFAKHDPYLASYAKAIIEWIALLEMQ
jgi:hypothetical protein